MTTGSRRPEKVTPQDKEIPETYTLRLPLELRKRVERLAESRRLSLNQQIVRILELYFIDAGDIGDSLKSLSGRLFEVTGEAYEGHGERAILIDLQVFDARQQRKIAAFNFGVDTETLKHLHVEKADQEQAVQELARALLRFYLRQGIEPEAISWSQYADRGYTNTRILHSEEIPDGVRTLEDLLTAINQDDWFDWPSVGNYLQDLNCRISKARDLSNAKALTQEIVDLTKNTVAHDPDLHEVEKELLTAAICITARKRGGTRSQLLYMRALVNSPKHIVFETLGKSDFDQLNRLKGAEDAKQAIAFARVNQRLLTLAPQPVLPALTSQKSLGGFNF